MKSHFIRDLAPDQAVNSTFLVQQKDIRQKKSGEPYLSLVLGDRTGDLDAKMWDNVAEVMDTFEREDFVKVKGVFALFHNRPQLTIHKMSRVGDQDVEFGDYFPASERDPAEMMAELRTIIGGLSNQHLRGLLELVFADPEVARLFQTAPAAKTIHHAWLGGLLEHVLSLCTLCRQVAPHYKLIDIDLLLTGAILHDIGKIHELSYDRGFSYSTDGQLLGHMMIALRLISEKLAGLPDFPPRLRTLVEHLIISHHGKLEFGSPKIPMFAEAVLLHYLDDMDSKMEHIRGVLDRDRLGGGDFTAYSPSLDRALLRKDRYLNPAPEPPARPGPAAQDSNGFREPPKPATIDQLEAKFVRLRPTAR